MLIAALIAVAILIAACTGLAILEWGVAGLADHRRMKVRRGERADISHLN